MKASDFTSDPKATMEGLRKEAAQQVRLFEGYLRQNVEKARSMGLKVSFSAGGNSVNDVSVNRIWMDQKPLEF